ncbi:hypothetical protein Rsub_09683 [Raphidocelis subcapitata]|uniref:CASTOR/POLLUX/SYM8 ion channel conserved domain-containing protein n=1 Tax=Raphidocelis subcapitata TaxID=307507 RepID=A0A2V0PHT3_9CHLO|nr:hypothetical protein Rsub_09683 [Raphidocelis subcapitata]|eukprot:GBF96827.1 hypothetical protein Rsub_09683 [Raphidocelis subcapitata]
MRAFIAPGPGRRLQALPAARRAAATPLRARRAAARAAGPDAAEAEDGAESALKRLPAAAAAGAACLALAASQCGAALAVPPPRRPAHAAEARVAVRAPPLASTTLAGPAFDTAHTAAWLRYRVLQLFSMPTTGKLLAVLAVAVPVLLVGGLAYKAAMNCTWQEAITKAYHAMGNVPGTIAKEQSKAAMFIVNAVYLAGIMSFAVVLGILSADIAAAVREVRAGNFPVVERGHTVLLGWNRQTLATLRQIAVAQSRAGAGGAPFGLPVVVLADRDKDEMDREVHDAVGGRLAVITRSGSSTRLEDLRRAAVGSAGTVLLQYPEGKPKNRAHAEQAAALAALKRESSGQKVIVQGDGEAAAEGFDAAAVALNAARGWTPRGGAAGGAGATGVGEAELVITSGPRRVGQVMCMVAFQPGLEYVLSDLLEFEEAWGEGSRLCTAPLDGRLVGRPYRDVRRSFESGAVVGYMDGGELRLNPKDNEQVPYGAELVLVTGKDGPQPAAAPAAPEMPRLRRAGRGAALQRRHVAVLCFGTAADAAPMLDALRDFAPRGSRVTVVCSDPVGKDALRALQRRGVKVSQVEADPGAGAALERAGLEKADAAVVCGLGPDAAAGDAQVVATVLQLQALSARHQDEGRRAKPLDVVAAVGSNSTEEVLWHATISHSVERALADAEAAPPAGRAKPEAARGERHAAPAVELHLLNPDQLMAGLVTHASMEPRLNRVFAELLTSDSGHEIYLRPASGFGLPPAGRAPAPVTWAQIQEAVRARGQTAIGVAPAGGGPLALRLAPAADDTFDLAAADELVVIARN